MESFKFVYERYTSDRIESTEPLQRLNFIFRRKFTLSLPQFARENSDKIALRKLLAKLKKVDFYKLELVCTSGMYVNGVENRRFLRFLEVKTTKNLILLCFRWCAFSEKMISSLHQFVKQRYEEDRPLEYIQLIRLYISNIQGYNYSKLGYLLSRVAIFTKKFFNTQTDVSTNQMFYHFFLTAADYCNRKKVQSYISLGVDFHNLGNLFESYENTSKVMGVEVYGNPRGWNQQFDNNDSIQLETTVLNGNRTI